MLNLPPGEYRISKKLSLNESAFNEYFLDFVENQLTSCDIQTKEEIAEDLLAINDVAGCYETTEDGYNECEIMLEMMETDYYPGGEYAPFDFNNPYTPQTEGIFATNEAGEYNFVMYFGGPNSGVDYEFILINGIERHISELSAAEFALNIISNSEWIDVLVKNHPYYSCYLTCQDFCTENTECKDFEDMIRDIETYAEAEMVAGLIDPNTCAPRIMEIDPCFDLTDPCDTRYESILAEVTNYNEYCCTDIGLTSIVVNMIFCRGENPCLETFCDVECDNTKDLAWQAWRDIYLSVKSMVASTNDCNLIDYVLDRYSTEELGGFTGINDVTEEEYNETAEQNNLDLATECDQNCEEMANSWISRLKECSMSDEQEEMLMDAFDEICMGSCGYSHPFGSTDCAPEASCVYNSYQDAIKAILMVDDCDLDCNPFEMVFPGTYENGTYLGNKTISSIQEYDIGDGENPVVYTNCLCDRLDEIESYYDPTTKGPTLRAFIESYGGYQITSENLTLLKESCNSNCNQLDGAVPIPPILDCDTCKPYNEVIDALNINGCTPAINSSPNVADLKNTHVFALNYHFGWTMQFWQVKAYLENKPTNTTEYFLCPVVPYPAIYEDDACEETIKQIVCEEANHIYQNQIDNLKQEFIAGFTKACNNLNEETFTATGNFNEYHYTLYYYDQSGNLVKTIPPKGVKIETNLTGVQNHRADDSNPAVYPPHTMATTYLYNSLNQITEQNSPDTEEATKFWYDMNGRLILSQDGRQHPTYYSYTFYDELGRIVEVGECDPVDGIPETLNGNYIEDLDAFHTFINSAPNNERKYITQTFYDKVAFSLTNIEDDNNLWEQDNLRNRVASVCYEEIYDADNSTCDQATHYSYDVTGNVDDMVCEIAAFGTSGARYKRLNYEFDLVSGNVNVVNYQKGLPDQFSQAYVYDENNRLIEAYSSLVETDADFDLEMNSWWEREANYDYYQHGPLKRTLIGNNVQGMDYAYTLQGWIKGLNSAVVDPSKDMGNDANQTIGIAKDAIACNLEYFTEDYKPIGGTAVDFQVQAGNNSFVNQGQDLFNGNISRMVVDIDVLNDPVGYKYDYDQLHRIKGNQLDRNISANNLNWFNGTIGDNFNALSDITYDPNGNITTLKRYSGLNLMDDLSYNFEDIEKNKLEWVEDMASSTVSNDDLDSQLIGNYEYDDAGNLIKDDQTTIEWNAYGKVEQVLKSNGAKIIYDYDVNQNRLSKTFIDATNAVEKQIIYIRDAQGNVISVYEKDGTVNWIWKEAHLYGSSRIGILNVDKEINWASAGGNEPIFLEESCLNEGWKRYELSNHLGNVLAVVNDRKSEQLTPGTNSIELHTPTVISAQDYYPFGQVMEDRTYSALSESHRYGFNGKESDVEGEWGGLTHYDYGFRIYNPAIAKFLSVDPLTKSYPWYTPYQFAGNTPIGAIDLDGLEEFVVTDKPLADYPKIRVLKIIPIRESQRSVNPDSPQHGINGVEYRVPNFDQNGKVTSVDKIRIADFPEDSAESIYLSQTATFIDNQGNEQVASKRTIMSEDLNLPSSRGESPEKKLIGKEIFKTNIQANFKSDKAGINTNDLEENSAASTFNDLNNFANFFKSRSLTWQAENTIRVTGSTDSNPTSRAGGNEKLALDRAESAVNFLRSQGLGNADFEIKGNPAKEGESYNEKDRNILIEVIPKN